MIEKYLNNKTNPTNLNCFFEMIILFVGKSVSGVFELITIWKSKSIKQTASTKKLYKSTNKMSFIQSSQVSKQAKQFIDYAAIALVSLMKIGERYWSNAIESENPDNIYQMRYQLKGFQILPTMLFYKLIIKQRLFYHHWVSLIMIIISLVAIMINAFIIAENPIDLLILEIQYIGIFTITALIDTLYKWLMDIKNISEYFLIFFEGIFGIILTIIFILALPSNYQSSLTMESFSQSVNRIFSEYYYILLVIGNILMNCGYYIFLLLTIKYYTPIHKAVCESLYSFLWIPEKSLFGSLPNMLDYITYIIGYVVIGIFGLIYNEIIIIHLCRLDEYTYKQIHSRSVREVAIAFQERVLIEDQDEEMLNHLELQ